MTYLLTNYQTLYYLCWSPYTPAYRSGLTCIGDEDARAPKKIMFMHVLSLEERMYTFIYVIIQIKLFKPTINMYITHIIDHRAITINCYNKAKI